MIEELRLKNFQAHKHSSLDLHPGVNAIIGSSDQGKSSVLRAIRWAWKNRPVGTAHVSHWALDKKGNQAEPCQVSLRLSGGEVSRLRDKDINGYTVNNTELEAIKTDVPEEVQQVFNWTETNVQGQHDSPFLISESPGEVARFFNTIVDLGDIDTILKAAESDRRATARASKDTGAALEENQQALDNLAWIEAAEGLVKAAEAIQTGLVKTEKEEETLTGEIAGLEKARRVLSGLPVVPEGLEDCLSGVLGLKSGITTLEEQTASISRDIRTLTEYRARVKRDYSAVSSALDSFLAAEQEVYDTQQDILELERNLRSHDRWVEKIQEAAKKVKELKAQLPEVCPTCGTILGGKE